MRGNLSIAILDDHPLILQGLKELLMKNNPKFIITTFEQPLDFKSYILNHKVDIAIVDIRIYKSDAGLDIAKFIVTKKSTIKLLVYSGNIDYSYISECMKIGANAFVSKDSPINNILNAINAISNGEFYYSDDVLNIIHHYSINEEKLSKESLKENLLTSREIDIIKLICKGYQNYKIAEILGISKNTVRTHRQNILSKTNTHNSQTLYSFAIKNRIIVDY